jgi:hypothetical protein
MHGDKAISVGFLLRMHTSVEASNTVGRGLWLERNKEGAELQMQVLSEYEKTM